MFLRFLFFIWSWFILFRLFFYLSIVNLAFTFILFFLFFCFIIVFFLGWVTSVSLYFLFGREWLFVAFITTVVLISFRFTFYLPFWVVTIFFYLWFFRSSYILLVRFALFSYISFSIICCLYFCWLCSCCCFKLSLIKYFLRTVFDTLFLFHLLFLHTR